MKYHDAKYPVLYEGDNNLTNILLVVQSSSVVWLVSVFPMLSNSRSLDVQPIAMCSWDRLGIAG